MNRHQGPIALGTVAIVVAGVVACSGSKSHDIGSQPDTAGAQSQTPGGSTDTTQPSTTPTTAATTPAPTPSSTSTTQPPVDSGAPPAATCAVITGANSKVPDLGAAACKSCVIENCCDAYTACYGAPPAVGVKGADGKKTQCMLFGECSDKCAGDVVCDAQCEVDYTAAKGEDWTAVDACVAESCSDFCE